MRRLVMFAVVVTFAAACAQTVNVEQEKAALLAVDADWSKTTADLDKFMSFMAPGATMSLSGAPLLTGEQAIRDALGPMSKAPGFALRWQATRADVSASGDLGYTAGTYALTMNDPAGVPATEKGKFLTTWKKINGSWRVVEDATAIDPR